MNFRSTSSERLSDMDFDNFVSNDFGSLDEDTSDESWLQDFPGSGTNTLDMNGSVSTAATISSTDNPRGLNNLSSKKRKSEIMCVIKGYADELQKKRRENAAVDEDTQANRAIEEDKKKRMEFFDLVIDAFNIGDFELMATILRNNVRDDCVFHAQCIKKGLVGLNPLLLFYGLLHEAYPDAMVKILERRISSSKRPPNSSNNKNTNSSTNAKGTQTPDESESDQKLHRVDYVYKLVGTRISSCPVYSVYNAAIEKLEHQTRLTQDSISAAINAMLTNEDGGPASTGEGGECAYIVETGLTFDNNNKIIEWTYDVLAADTT